MFKNVVINDIIMVKDVMRMTKRKYLNSLKKELKIFNDVKQEKYYKKYKDKFDDLSKSGLSDEEVIKEMGSVDLIIDNILENEKKHNKNKKNDTVNDKNKYVRIIVDEAKDFVNKIGELLNVKSDDELLKLVVDVLLLFLCVMLLKAPFTIIREIGISVFNIFPNFISGLFSLVWGLIVQIGYMATSIYLIYMIVKKVFIGEKTSSEGIKEIKNDIKKEVNKNDLSNQVLKGLLFIVTLPLYFIWFLLFIGLGITVGLILNGVMVTGILLIIISLLIIFASAIKLVNSMVFGGK